MKWRLEITQEPLWQPDLVPGAWLGRPGVSNAVVGEWGLSRSERKLGEATARQWSLRLCVYGWCRAQRSERICLCWVCKQRRKGWRAVIDASKWACRRPFVVAGLWKVASGQTRGTRKRASRLAANWRRTLDVCLAHGEWRLCFFWWAPVWIARGDNRNVVTPRRTRTAGARYRFCNLDGVRLFWGVCAWIKLPLFA